MMRNEPAYGKPAHGEIANGLTNGHTFRTESYSRGSSMHCKLNIDPIVRQHL